jgi:hypothetical protein
VEVEVGEMARAVKTTINMKESSTFETKITANIV